MPEIIQLPQKGGFLGCTNRNRIKEGTKVLQDRKKKLGAEQKMKGSGKNGGRGVDGWNSATYSDRTVVRVKDKSK